MSFIVDFFKCSKRSLSNTCSFLLSSIHTWLVPIITTSFFRLFHYLRFHLKFIIRISWVGAWLSVLSELRWWTLCVTKRILRESPLSTQCWVRKRRGAGARSTRDDGGPRARFTAGETHTQALWNKFEYAAFSAAMEEFYLTLWLISYEQPKLDNRPAEQRSSQHILCSKHYNL